MGKASGSTVAREAEARGIQASYVDGSGQTQQASEETLCRLLDLLGPEQPVSRIPRVLVLWQNRRVKVPALPRHAKLKLRLEDGTERTLSSSALASLRLPAGYHQLYLSSGQREETSLLISAPTRLYSEPLRTWGAFLPLYAAHSKNSWGAGNFSDWSRLCAWIGAQGGSVAGTLPILTSLLDYPTCEPSPYSPASRLFWNEFFIDITAIPEYRPSATGPHRQAIKKFQASDFIDYPAEWAVRKKVLVTLAADFKNSPRQAEFKAYLRDRPEAVHYARFRAACENYRTNWRTWPKRIQCAGEVKDFYLYVQWIAQQQLDKTLATCRDAGVKFYLDLPLGVNPDGFDAWRYQKFFAQGVSAGAPPDSFFTKGQDWGFAPLHPARSREEHYRYVIDYLRFQMRHTGLLRIDHVMGLHRLWWVPHGRPASEGAYVRYPADELYAILSVESHRHRTMLVGENLGTVPPEVNRSMDRHGLRRMYVLQYEQQPQAPPRPPERTEVASLNTHDMPAFAAHWNGADLADRSALGLIPSHDLSTEKRHRADLRKNFVTFLRKQRFLKTKNPRTKEILAAALKFLASSPAEIVLVTLEDLWLEERSQNVPGTSTERPNWRRKSRRTLEAIESDPELAELLRELSRLRA